jgi:hypothetical protein
MQLLSIFLEIGESSTINITFIIKNNPLFKRIQLNQIVKYSPEFLSFPLKEGLKRVPFSWTLKYYQPFLSRSMNRTPILCISEAEQ